MKKIGIMSAPISSVIAHLEHSNMLTVGDAGLFVSAATMWIDLAQKADFTPFANVILMAGAWGFNL